MNLEGAMKKLGRNVKALRKKKGLTQEKMRDLGFNYRYFQKIESGKVNTTLDTLIKLANVLGCSLARLLK